jgi:hypothetical protein
MTKVILNEYVKIAVKDVIYINSGGCGIFAKYFGDMLEKNGCSVEYIVLHHKKECGKDINSANESKDNIYNLLSASWTHIIILVNNKYYVDGRGVYGSIKEMDERDSRKRHNTKITKKVLDEMLKLKYSYSWNPVFNRREGKKKILNNLKAIKC